MHALSSIFSIRKPFNAHEETLLSIDVRIYMFLHKTPTNNFPIASFPLVQFLLIVLSVSHLHQQWESSVGGILSGVRFSGFAGASGYRIRPSNCILVLRSLDVGFVRLPVITGDCCDDITHVGFAELKETADDRANIGGTIIGGPILGQQLAQYILTDHQDADCRPMIRLILSRQW